LDCSVSYTRDCGRDHGPEVPASTQELQRRIGSEYFQVFLAAFQAMDGSDSPPRALLGERKECAQASGFSMADGGAGAGRAANRPVTLAPLRADISARLRKVCSTMTQDELDQLVQIRDSWLRPPTGESPS
jgi:hypothetical protein